MGYNKDDRTFVSFGIGCERCHGLGAQHVAGGGDKSKIRVSTTVSVCEDCHGSRQVAQWKEAGHSRSLDAPLERPYFGNQCIGCHSARVLIDKEEGRTPPTVDDFRNGLVEKNAVSCVACHNPHERTYEHQLRKPVEQLCISCHTGELEEGRDTYDEGQEAHQAQKEMWEGRGAFGVEQIPGSMQATCADCHMTGGAISSGPGRRQLQSAIARSIHATAVTIT